MFAVYYRAGSGIQAWNMTGDCARTSDSTISTH
jgi:hypothetical protein